MMEELSADEQNYIKYLDAEMLIKETDREDTDKDTQNLEFKKYDSSISMGTNEDFESNFNGLEEAAEKLTMEKCHRNNRIGVRKAMESIEPCNIYIDSLVTLCLAIDRFELFYVSDEEIKILDVEKERVICINRGSFIDNTLMLENMDRTDEVMERYEVNDDPEVYSPMHYDVNNMPNSQPPARKAIDFMNLGDEKVTFTNRNNRLVLKKQSQIDESEKIYERKLNDGDDEDDSPSSLMFPPNPKNQKPIKDQPLSVVNIEDFDRKEQEKAWNQYQNEKVKNLNEQVIIDDQGRRKSRLVTFSHIKKKKHTKVPAVVNENSIRKSSGLIAGQQKFSKGIGMYAALDQNFDNYQPISPNHENVGSSSKIIESKLVEKDKLPNNNIKDEYGFLQLHNSNSSPDEYDKQLNDAIKASLEPSSQKIPQNNFDFMDIATSDDYKFMNSFDPGFLIGGGKHQANNQQRVKHLVETSFEKNLIAKTINKQENSILPQAIINQPIQEEKKIVEKNPPEQRKQDEDADKPQFASQKREEENKIQPVVKEEIKDEQAAPAVNFDGYDDDLMLDSDFGDDDINDNVPKPSDALKPSNDTITTSKKSFNQEDSHPIDPLTSNEPVPNLISQVTIKKVSSVRPDYSTIKIDEQLMLQNVMQNKGYSNVLSNLVNKVKKLELKLIEANSKIHEKEKDIKLMKKVSKMKIHGHDQREIHFAFLFASPLVRYIDDRKEQVMLLDCLKELEDICGVVNSVDYQLKFRSSVATKDNFRSVVTDKPYVLHFSGHGLPNDPKVLGNDYFDNQGKGGVLLLEDNKCRSYNYYQEELRSLLEA